MILFKPEHAPLILSGQKTQTRRLWKKPRVKVGSIHKCYTRPPFAKGGAEPFCSIRIMDVWKSNPFFLTDEEVRAEGFPTLRSFWRKFIEINGYMPNETWAVEFEVVENRANKGQEQVTA